MKTVCVDIDGTLVHYEKWQGDNHFGKLVPGAAEAMKTLKEKGWFIIIYTTRGNKEAVRKFLDNNEISNSIQIYDDKLKQALLFQINQLNSDIIEIGTRCDQAMADMKPIF